MPVIGGLAAAVLCAVSGLAVAAPAAATTTSTTSTTSPGTASSISVSGHGWGHGRGLGQWGALGYALAGQSYTWIADHFYGGTTVGTVANGNIRVRLVENDGNDLIATSQSAFTVAGRAVPAGGAARLHLTSTPDLWQVDTAPSCAGPWTAVGQASDRPGSSPAAVIQPSTDDPSAPTSALLQLCMAGGNMTVRGALAAAQFSGSPRTVNVLALDTYLRGVVGSESPSGWGSLGSTGAQGRPQGFQALEAQAVAARSYAVADERANGGNGVYGYADICDTSSCQVYRAVAGESANAVAAVVDTPGQIRVTSAGAPARTEFSSSTGGWSAGGQFPAVVDDGDAVCVSGACNPNHDWTASVSVSSIQSAYPSIGTLRSVDVTSRTGPAAADYGGRVAQVRLTGSAGTVTITGNTFAAQFGLRSNWFSIGSAGSSGSGSTSPTSTTTSTTSTTSTSTTSTTRPSSLPPSVKSMRVAGADREATAVAASQTAFPTAHSARAVVLARADAYADALTGAPLAAREGGPLLLTPSVGLSPPVLAEIQRVLPASATVFILGGSGAVSPSVDSALVGQGFKVVRIEGGTRYATAVAVAHQLGDPHTVFEVTGADFPDGLAAGPAAISQGAAVLLTDGSSQAPETASYLSAHSSDVRYAIGGPAHLADRAATSVAGADRYATSVLVARRFFTRPTVVGVATGSDFPDALAAGPALGSAGPLLLVPPAPPAPTAAADYLSAVGPGLRSFDVFGGTSAVAPGAVSSLTRSAG